MKGETFMPKNDAFYHAILAAVREAPDDDAAIAQIRTLLETDAAEERTDEEMEFELQDFFEEDGEDWMDEDELAHIRDCIEALCPKDVVIALDLKGYSCYEGSRLYAQDWQVARDCFERLVKISDNPYYANTLGYIYYYGRTGAPDYEKAYKLFQFGAIHGIQESIYKLGDMYRKGLGVPKRPGVAYALYRRTYDEARETFIEQPDGNFADAALRMGDVFRDGIDVEPDPVRAYHYYLEADCAARRRTEVTEFWGAREVAETAARALQDAESRLPQDYLSKELAEHGPYFFQSILGDGFLGELRVEEQKGDLCVLALGRRKNGVGRIPFLVTEPRIRLCCVVEELRIMGIGGKVAFQGKKRGRVLFDAVRWEEERHRITLYFAEKKVGMLSCKAYRLDAENDRQESDEKGGAMSGNPQYETHL